MKTSDLIGPALDYAVAVAQGLELVKDPFGSVCAPGWWVRLNPGYQRVGGGYSPSTNRDQAFLILEEEGIELLCNLSATEAARFSGGAKADWQAFHRSDRRTEARQFAVTPMIAIARFFVASKLGDEVDIQEDLK